MPVEFLTDAQAGAYGRFAGVPARLQLERFFFLDDDDLGLVGRRRGDHNRLGFAVQLATVRFVGAFLADPADVPGDIVEYVAGQLDVAAASMATYTQREKTRLEHQWEMAREVGYRDFVDAGNRRTRPGSDPLGHGRDVGRWTTRVCTMRTLTFTSTPTVPAR